MSASALAAAPAADMTVRAPLGCGSAALCNREKSHLDSKWLCRNKIETVLCFLTGIEPATDTEADGTEAEYCECDVRWLGNGTNLDSVKIYVDVICSRPSQSVAKRDGLSG